MTNSPGTLRYLDESGGWRCSNPRSRLKRQRKIDYPFDLRYQQGWWLSWGNWYVFPKESLPITYIAFLCAESKIWYRRPYYNAVQYNRILHTTLQELRQNINQSLYPLTKITPKLALCCEYLGDTWPRYKGTALYFGFYNHDSNINILKFRLKVRQEKYGRTHYMKNINR